MSDAGAGRPAGYEGRRNARCAVFGFAVAVVCFAAFHSGGVLVPPQGRTLLQVAANLADGNGFNVSDRVPLGRYPAGYALALSVPARFGLDPVAAVYLVNAASFGATLYAMLALALALRVGPVWVLGASLSVLASQLVFLRMALPDGLMVCASAVALLGVARYAERPSRRVVVWTALACAMAAGARYMALFTLLPLVALALYVRAGSARERWSDGALFAALAGLPSLVWLLRNWIKTGFLLGMSRTEGREQFGSTGLSDNVVGVARTFWLDLFGYGEMGSRNFVYDGVPLAMPLASALSLALTLVLLAALVVARRHELRALARRISSPREFALGAVLAYVLVYVAALVAIWTVGNNDPIATRYVAPIYPWLVFLGFAAHTGLGRIAAPAWQRNALLVVGLTLLAPNVTKSVVLLGDPPSGRMLEVETRKRRRQQWQRDFAWEAIPAPRPPADARSDPRAGKPAASDTTDPSIRR